MSPSVFVPVASGTLTHRFSYLLFEALARFTLPVFRARFTGRGFGLQAAQAQGVQAIPHSAHYTVSIPFQHVQAGVRMCDSHRTADVSVAQGVEAGGSCLSLGARDGCGPHHGTP